MVVGTGSLASEICFALSSMARCSCTVVVIGRSKERLLELRHAAQSLAEGSAVRFESACIDFENQDDYAENVGGFSPEVVINCTSYHSPWEGERQPSSWTSFVAKAGFGVTLPLQALFSVRLAKALACEGSSAAIFINACFPDAVNPIIASLELPVFCGIGNVSTIGASLSADLELLPQQRLRVLAHHAHLHHAVPGLGEPLAWVDTSEVKDMGRRLSWQRTLKREQRNRIAGVAAAKLVFGILAEEKIRTNLPGPLGLTGGYPVRLTGRNVELDLPECMTRAEAISWNEQASLGDGLQSIRDGRVTFTDEAKATIYDLLPDLASGFATGDLDEACADLLGLREHLRQVPPNLEFKRRQTVNG